MVVQSKHTDARFYFKKKKKKVGVCVYAHLHCMGFFSLFSLNYVLQLLSINFLP